MFNIVLEGEERQTVDKHTEDVIVIDTSPIGTVDFNLTPYEKKFLLQMGKAAGLRFLLNKKIDGGPTEELVRSVEAEGEAMRRTILAQRFSRKILRSLLAGLMAISAVLLWKYLA